MEYKATYRLYKKGKSAGRYGGILTYCDADGNRRQLTKTFPKEVNTDGKARRALDAWSDEVKEGDRKREEEEARSSGLTTQTAFEYASTYVDSLESTQAVEPSTITGYRSTISCHFEGSLKEKPLRDLTPSDVETWVSWMLNDEGLSTTTAAKSFRLLRQTCKHACALGELAHNPTDPVKAPKRKGPDPNALDAEGRARVCAALDAMPPTGTATAAYIALFTGMREGEVCGLQWRDVEIDPTMHTGVLHVRHAVGRTDHGCYLKEPKNRASRRDVPVVAELGRALERRRAHMMDVRRKGGWDNSPASFSELFVVGDEVPDPSGDPWRNPGIIGREWRTISRSLGLVGTKGRGITFHDLRHSFATTAIASGADIKSVSSFLGHANASMTLNVYADADPVAKGRTARLVADALAARPSLGEVIPFRPTGSD